MFASMPVESVRIDVCDMMGPGLSEKLGVGSCLALVFLGLYRARTSSSHSVKAFPSCQDIAIGQSGARAKRIAANWTELASGSEEGMKNLPGRNPTASSRPATRSFRRPESPR